MPKPKIIRKILSPNTVRAVDGVLEKRHEQREHQKQEREQNDRLLAPDGSVDVTNREAQAGRRITRPDFIRRLMKLNENLRYQQSKHFPAQGGIYMIGYRRDNLLGTTEYGEWFLCGIPHDVIDEFSVPLTKPTVIPSMIAPVWDTIPQVDGLRRGWRAVLLKLLQEGLLTPSQIDNEFQISKGRSSQKWQQAAVN